MLLAWSQRRRGERWQGKVILLQQERKAAEAVLSEASDVLFPQPQAGPKGRYWVAYEKAEAKGSEIVLRDLTKDLEASGSK